MNTFAIKALGAVSLSMLAIAPAAAEDVRVAVSYADLDIATAQGAEVLHERLQAGIRAACARPDIRDLKAVAAWDQCRDTAMSSALEQLAHKGATIG